MFLRSVRTKESGQLLYLEQSVCRRGTVLCSPLLSDALRLADSTSSESQYMPIQNQRACRQETLELINL